MVTSLVAGLAVGAIYAFIAVGYNLTFLTARVFNFAHAHLLVLAMFVSVALLHIGVPPLATVAITGIGIALLAVVEELLAVGPLRKRSGGSHMELVTTLGVAEIITGVIIVVWGSDPIRVPSPVELGSFDILGGRIQNADLVIIGVVLIFSGALALIIRRTRFGHSALAQSEDREAAALRGINIAWLSVAGFALSGLVVGLAALPIGGRTFAVVSIALTLAIKGFIAMTLGGVGSIGGAIIGGLSLGVIEALTERVLGTSFRDIAVFLVFVAVVLLRPQGIFGSVKQRIV